MTNDLFETGGVGETKLRVAMRVHGFSLVSETFVINQLVGLMRLGHEVDIYSFGAEPPNATLTEPDVAQYRLLERTKYPAASPRDGLKRLHWGVRQGATLLSESNSVSGACAGLPGGGNSWRQRIFDPASAARRNPYRRFANRGDRARRGVNTTTVKSGSSDSRSSALLGDTKGKLSSVARARRSAGCGPSTSTSPRLRIEAKDRPDLRSSS